MIGQPQPILPIGYNQAMMFSHTYEDQVAPLPFGYNSNTSYTVNNFVPNSQDFAPTQSVLIKQPTKSNSGAPKTEKVLDWILYFLPLIFAIIVVFITANIFYSRRASQMIEVNKANFVLENLIANLGSAPILEIQNGEEEITTLSHFQQTHLQLLCPPGFQQENLGIWPGIQSGCLCDDGSVQSSSYCLIHNSCHQIQEKQPAYFRLWKKETYCIRRANNWKWISDDDDCEDGFQKCRGNICIIATQNCPITNLVKVTAADQKNQDSNGNKGGKKIKIGNDNYYSEINQGQPLIGFSFTPGGNTQNAPCFENDLSPEFESGLFYPLQNMPAKGCDQYDMESKYAINLDQDLVTNVYQQNYFQPTLTEIPLYSNYMDPNDTFLFQGIKRMSIGSNSECKSISVNDIFQIKQKSSNLYDYTTFICVVCLVLSILIIILLPALFIFRNKVNNFKDLLRIQQFDLCNLSNWNQLKIFLWIGIVISLLLIILGVVYIRFVEQENGLQNLHEKFSNYLSYSCFPDQSVSKALEIYTEFSLKSYKNYHFWIKFAFYLSLAFIILILVFLLIKHLKYNEPWCLEPWNIE